MPTERIQHIVLVHDSSSGYCRQVLEGIFAFARPAKRWVFRPARQDPNLIPLFQSWDVTGMIAQVTTDEFADAAETLRIPVVNVSSNLDTPRFAQICNDDIAIGQAAAEHLLDAGLTQFAFFGYGWSAYSSNRQIGFTQTIEERGHNVAPMLYQRRPDTNEGPHDWRRWDDNVRRWLQSLPRPCGVFACHDVAAVDLISICCDAGIRVPDELTILGVDDDDLLCRQSYPPLSSVRCAAEQIGFQAAQMLEDLFADRAIEDSPRRLAPIGIATRQSTDILAVDDPDLAHALRYIRDNADKPIDVEDVLRRVPMNRRTLERRFRTVLGRTPLQEIRRVHIEQAKQLLVDTDLPTPNIATASGFANASRLAIIFRKMTGMKPTEYRNRFRKR
jgi:LacI family transcriptional regulator